MNLSTPWRHLVNVVPANRTMERAAGSCASDITALVDNLDSLVNNQETADVIFIVGRQEVTFYAHKLLLWARFVWRLTTMDN